MSSQSSRIAVYPGSFDPPTLGHADLILRASKIFEEVHVMVGINSSKTNFMDIESRLNILTEIFTEQNNVKVQSYQGLTVDFCKKVNAWVILRGIRNPQDFTYENDIAFMNKNLDNGIETVFLAASPDFVSVSSSLIKEVLKNGGDVTRLVPRQVIEHFNRKG